MYDSVLAASVIAAAPANPAEREFTIKEEGRPPWAGGPKALVLVPWPSEEDE
jgi:hypothetical protein